jgi:hypothetical protein
MPHNVPAAYDVWAALMQQTASRPNPDPPAGSVCPSGQKSVNSRYAKSGFFYLEHYF